MILHDTNIVSEVMRAAPAQMVLDWFAKQVAFDLYLTSTVEAELRFGILLLPNGKRKKVLTRALDEMLDEDFAGRVLPFDSAAAQGPPAMLLHNLHMQMNRRRPRLLMDSRL